MFLTQTELLVVSIDDAAMDQGNALGCQSVRRGAGLQNATTAQNKERSFGEARGLRLWSESSILVFVLKANIPYQNTLSKDLTPEKY